MPSSSRTLPFPLLPAALWVPVSWLTIFLVGTDLFIVSAFLPLIGRELHQSPAAVAVLVSAFSLTYALACPLLGRLAERWGLRNVLFAGVGALALANAYTALAPNLWQLTLSRVLAGLAAAGISPMLYAMAAERAAPAQRAARLAQINSGLVIALCLGAPFGLWLGQLTHWRMLFAALGVALLAMVPVNAVVWSGSLPHQAPVRQDSSEERLWQAWPLLLCMCAWAVSVYACYTLLATALVQTFAAPAAQVALTLACFGAGATGGVLAGGRLADRLGAARQVRLSLALMTACFGLCLLAYRQHGLWLLAAALFTEAFVAYGFFPALQACAAQAFHTRRPTVLGLLSSALYVGITLGAALGGRLYSAWGMTAVLLLSAAVAAAACLLTRHRLFSADTHQPAA
ncbi:MFS transporter [Paludibacterium sp. THUN1379]|uniref:MFS transporter n=1 Tax=Paludibacterium sp. THUN1379 TaxID=3112107 RepID=UPI00308CE2C6|nr:MFS transporter [Paludibacterium sp. THUN1379]